MDADSQAARLRQYIRFDVAGSVAGAVATVGVWAWVTRAGAVLVLAVVVLGAGATMAVGLVPLRRHELARAVTWVAAGNWVAAVGVSVLAPFALPVMTLAALLPIVLAVPYVSRRRLVAFIAVSTAVLVAATVLAVHDVGDLGVRTPTWAQRGVVVAFLPLIAGLVATIAWQNGVALSTTLTAVLAANRRLRASELALAAQAEQLAASRSRLATAADEERRRIERNLHDGAQQRLLAVSAGILGLRALCRRAPEQVAPALQALASEVRAATVELRDLAHGLYPAVLSDHGLGDTLAAAAARSGMPYRLDLGPCGRRSRDVEASVYFCCAEALHNAMKHAGEGATVTVALWDGPSGLAFEVADDGAGFDPATAPSGHGLLNMADRMASVGGTLDVGSAPGRGVRVRGLVPVGAAQVEGPLPGADTAPVAAASPAFTTGRLRISR